MVESRVCEGDSRGRTGSTRDAFLPASLPPLASPACLHLHSVTVHSSNLIASHCIASHRIPCSLIDASAAHFQVPLVLSSAQLDSTRLESRGISASLSKKEKKNRSSLRFYANCCNISYARLFMFLAGGGRSNRQEGEAGGGYLKVDRLLVSRYGDTSKRNYRFRQRESRHRDIEQGQRQRQGQRRDREETETYTKSRQRQRLPACPIDKVF